MKRAIAKQWVAALRSGQYKQGTGQLRQGDKFCCLGVLCNLHAQAHPGIAAAQRELDGYLGEDVFLPKQVQEWAGMKNDNGSGVSSPLYQNTSLAELNDYGYTFTQIAKIIEDHIPQL